jgi:hypothetical protein
VSYGKIKAVYQGYFAKHNTDFSSAWNCSDGGITVSYSPDLELME